MYVNLFTIIEHLTSQYGTLYGDQRGSEKEEKLQCRATSCLTQLIDKFNDVRLRMILSLAHR